MPEKKGSVFTSSISFDNKITKSIEILIWRSNPCYCFFASSMCKQLFKDSQSIECWKNSRNKEKIYFFFFFFENTHNISSRPDSFDQIGSQGILTMPQIHKKCVTWSIWTRDRKKDGWQKKKLKTLQPANNIDFFPNFLRYFSVLFFLLSS